MDEVHVSAPALEVIGSCGGGTGFRLEDVSIKLGTCLCLRIFPVTGQCGKGDFFFFLFFPPSTLLLDSLSVGTTLNLESTARN